MKIIAADIASVSDYTTAAVRAVSDDSPRRYFLSVLDRWREKYTTTVDRLAGLARHPAAALVIDATGEHWWSELSIVKEGTDEE